MAGIQRYVTIIKEINEIILEKKIGHVGNPVLRYMMDNIYVKTDLFQNIKLDKEKSTENIDSAVAIINTKLEGLSYLLAHQGK